MSSAASLPSHSIYRCSETPPLVSRNSNLYLVKVTSLSCNSQCNSCSQRCPPRRTEEVSSAALGQSCLDRGRCRLQICERWNVERVPVGSALLSLWTAGLTLPAIPGSLVPALLDLTLCLFQATECFMKLSMCGFGFGLAPQQPCRSQLQRRLHDVMLRVLLHQIFFAAR